jgi:hypothetical protein
VARERHPFGGDAFEIYVEKVGGIERQIGMNDVAQLRYGD